VAGAKPVTAPQAPQAAAVWFDPPPAGQAKEGAFVRSHAGRPGNCAMVAASFAATHCPGYG
jgi:hypothetical protein